MTRGVALIALSLVACNPVLETARRYEDLGHHELAIRYYADNFRETPDDEDARAQFERSYELATRNLDADLKAAQEAGEMGKALAFAARRETMQTLARASGLQAPETSAVAKGLKAAARHALEAVDRAPDAKPVQRLKLLRRALALDPDNAELAVETRRLQASLRRSVSVRLDCPPDRMSACERVSATIQREVTRARRELVRFVTTDSDDRNAELVLSVPVRSLSDSGWIRIKQGKAVCKVPKENRFREVVEGQYESVSARFEVLERVSRAQVRILATVQDLRPPHQELVSMNRQKKSDDEARHYRFDGDERAFNGHTYVRRKNGAYRRTANPFSNVRSYGTNAQAPSDPEVLARQAEASLAAEIAAEIVSRLENPS